MPEPIDEEKIKRAANLEAKQRAMEREVRKWKRLAEGTQDKKTVDRYRKKAKDAQKALREFVREHGDVLRRDPWREQTHNVPLAEEKKPDILKSNANLRAIPISEQGILSIPEIETKTLPTEQNKKLRRAHQELLREVINDPPETEAVAYYGVDMKLIERRKGGRFRVPALAVQQDHVVMHNHPSGTTFTLNDIKVFLRDEGLKVLTAVGNDGSVYCVEKLPEYSSDAARNYFCGEEKADQDHMKSPENYLEFMERLLKGAEQHGIRYIRG